MERMRVWFTRITKRIYDKIALIRDNVFPGWLCETILGVLFVIGRVLIWLQWYSTLNESWTNSLRKNNGIWIDIRWPNIVRYSHLNRSIHPDVQVHTRNTQSSCNESNIQFDRICWLHCPLHSNWIVEYLHVTNRNTKQVSPNSVIVEWIDGVSIK